MEGSVGTFRGIYFYCDILQKTILKGQLDVYSTIGRFKDQFRYIKSYREREVYTEELQIPREQHKLIVSRYYKAH